MNDETYTNEELTSFLLGTLPAERADFFDELSFTDDRFAELLNITEKDLVDAFAQGELTGERLERFNSYYLSSPLRRQKAEFARAFQQAAEKEVPIAEESRKKSLAGYLSALLTFPRVSLRWGFALAAASLVFFGGWMFYENARLRSELSRSKTGPDDRVRRESDPAEWEKPLDNEPANRSTANSEVERELAEERAERERLAQEELKDAQQPKRRVAERESQTGAKTPARQKKERDGKPPGDRVPVIASFVLSPALRSGNQPVALSLPPGATSVALTLELETDDYTFYRAVLRDQTNDQSVWRSGRLRPQRRGTTPALKLIFPAGLLNARIYSVQISGVKNDGTTEIVSDYPFRAVLK
jgi:hypothetical protein